MVDKLNSLPVGLAYAQSQLAKILSQPEINNKKVQQWEDVLYQILQGQVDYGNRTPFADVPSWVTLEVAKGGFATGNWLAGGEITSDEQAQLDKLQIKVEQKNKRLALNSYYLTEEGMASLNAFLDNENYLITVPEEGVLLTLAWLVKHNALDHARKLLNIVSPWFSRLRFYPQVMELPVISSNTVRVQNLDITQYDLKRIKPNQRVLAQKEAVTIWHPFKVKMVALLSEIIQDLHIISITSKWRQSAKDLIAEYSRLRQQYSLCRKPEKRNGDFAKLRMVIEQLSLDESELNPYQAPHIATLLHRHIEKYGQPYSKQCNEKSQKQQYDIQAPLHYTLSRVILNRLADLDINNGFDNKALAIESITDNEANKFNVPLHYPIPNSLVHKTMRSFNTTASQLIEQKLITSSEALGGIIPQITAGLRAGGILDIPLRHLYEKIYRAFKQRRSLLLLDLQHQVQLEELPWIATIDKFREKQISNKIVFTEALNEFLLLNLRYFPQTQLPNPLLQELSSLTSKIDSSIRWSEELAADIFMGMFSRKISNILVNITNTPLPYSLYSQYYRIDYFQLKQELCDSLIAANKQPDDPYATSRVILKWCENRANLKFGSYSPTINGCILEQFYVLTTHNLSTIFNDLMLAPKLQPFLLDMSKQCLKIISRNLQAPYRGYHASLIAIKQAAYTWRQLVFYLSYLSPEERQLFIEWAYNYIDTQSQYFKTLFMPIWQGLISVINTPDDHNYDDKPPHLIFYGWSEKHWMMEHILKANGETSRK
ncbi:hypothetical protein [Proteus hauseri]|uniref:hypothetical protein n=1 Tax=Proteus hauseri TaxID=183417 RepID=UPI0032DA00EA